MAKRIVHTEAHINPNYEHPLNILASKYVAKAVGEDGTIATAKGDSKAGAIASAVSKVQSK
jgi:hypothetical protein